MIRGNVLTMRRHIRRGVWAQRHCLHSGQPSRGRLLPLLEQPQRGLPQQELLVLERLALVRLEQPEQERLVRQERLVLAAHWLEPQRRPQQQQPQRSPQAACSSQPPSQVRQPHWQAS